MPGSRRAVTPGGRVARPDRARLGDPPPHPAGTVAIAGTPNTRWAARLDWDPVPTGPDDPRRQRQD